MTYWMLVITIYSSDPCFAPYKCYTMTQHVAKGFPSAAACESSKKHEESVKSVSTPGYHGLEDVITATCYEVEGK